MAVTTKKTDIIKPTMIKFVVGRINIVSEIGFLEAEKEYNIPITEFNKIKYLDKENKIKVI